MPEWITAAVSWYEANKTLAGFFAGVIPTGVGWIISFCRHRQQLKDKAHALHLETLQLAADAVKTSTTVLNRAEAAHRELKRKAGPLPLPALADLKHGIEDLMRPNQEDMKRLYDVVSASEGLSLKEIKAFHLRVLKQKQLMDVVLEAVEGKIASVAEVPEFPPYMTREGVWPDLPRR